MRQSQGPFPAGEHAETIETESRRLTPSIGLAHESDAPTDSSNEDFLFHLYRGSELLQDNRVHEAKEELERALHLQPRDSKGQDLLAVVYFRLGLYPRAIQIYEQLRRRNTTDTALLLNLALCYLKTGQPQLARRDLEQLLAINTTHSRAWGYLGLACERLGDLSAAERAFRHGGHPQMARRIAQRRDAASNFPAADESAPNQEVRDVAGAAYQELDAGELSFALAEPTSERDVEEAAAQSWRPHELGRVTGRAEAQRPDTRKPDTRDGPPIAPSIPQLGMPHSLNRRPTLIAPVGAPPAHELVGSDFANSMRIPSHQPPSFTFDDAGNPSLPAPSVRRPVVAVPSPFGPAKAHEPELHLRGATLPPPPGPGSAPPPRDGPASVRPGAHAQAPLSREELEERAPPSVRDLPPPMRTAEDPTVVTHHDGATVHSPAGNVLPLPAIRSARTPDSSELQAPDVPIGAAIEPRFPPVGVVLQSPTLALVRTTGALGFAVRLESIRAQQSLAATERGESSSEEGLSIALLDRHVKGAPTGEAFGGIASPMVHVKGEGQLVLFTRPGRKLHAFVVSEEMCFAREDVLFGFGGALTFENGRLGTGDNEHLAVVQLRGEGSVLFETIGDVLSLSVGPDRSLSVRREVVLGWFGRLVPRAIAPSDAPCGQRGLVSFAGVGRVLVATS